LLECLEFVGAWRFGASGLGAPGAWSFRSAEFSEPGAHGAWSFRDLEFSEWAGSRSVRSDRRTAGVAQGPGMAGVSRTAGVIRGSGVARAVGVTGAAELAGVARVIESPE
jgi:hypothetical protein